MMSVLGRMRLAPFAPYHWLLYGKPFWFDTARAHTELGWEPTYSKNEMFAESYDWFIEHRSELGHGRGSHHQSPVRRGALRLFKRAGRA